MLATERVGGLRARIGRPRLCADRRDRHILATLLRRHDRAAEIAGKRFTELRDAGRAVQGHETAVREHPAAAAGQLDGHPQLADYVARLTARPAFRKVHDEQVARSLVEDEVRGDPGIGAADDAGDRMLSRGPRRASDGRGRHTTVARELIALPGGALIYFRAVLRRHFDPNAS